jgi:hypothetical protein
MYSEMTEALAIEAGNGINTKLKAGSKAIEKLARRKQIEKMRPASNRHQSWRIEAKVALWRRKAQPRGETAVSSES